LGGTETDERGHYSFPGLPVGPYRLGVSAQGFKNYIQNGIELEVGSDIQANVTMQLGNVSQTVEVQANAAMVETRNSNVSQVIDEKRINDLPLNGRYATQLVLLSGASITVSPAGGDLTGSKNFYSSTTISVGGGQANGTNYLLDGGYNVDTFTNVNMPFPCLFARYFIDDYTLAASFEPTNALVTDNPGNAERAQTITLGDTYTLSPTTLNSAHFTFERRRDNRGPAAQGISPASLGSNVFSQDPNFLELSVSGYFSTYCGTCNHAYFNTNTWSYTDDMTLVRGRHEIMFGADIIRTQMNSDNNYELDGDYGLRKVSAGTTSRTSCSAICPATARARCKRPPTGRPIRVCTYRTLSA